MTLPNANDIDDDLPETFDDLVAAAASSFDFWDNPWDDEALKEDSL